MYYKSLDHIHKRLHDWRIQCVALQDPHNSSPRHLLSSGNDQGLITLFDWLVKNSRDSTINTVPSTMTDALISFMELVILILSMHGTVWE